MRIAIVNTLMLTLTNLRHILQTVPEYQVILTAQNGVEAVIKCQQNPPDLILMDLLMPIMDGVEATQQIMKHSPCAILIVTKSIQKNVAQVYAAMGYGALDAVDTPILDGEYSADMTNKLLAKIAIIGKLIKSPAKGSKAKLVRSISSFEQPSLGRLARLRVVQKH